MLFSRPALWPRPLFWPRVCSRRLFSPQLFLPRWQPALFWRQPFSRPVCWRRPWRQPALFWRRPCLSPLWRPALFLQRRPSPRVCLQRLFSQRALFSQQPLSPRARSLPLCSPRLSRPPTLFSRPRVCSPQLFCQSSLYLPAFWPRQRCFSRRLFWRPELFSRRLSRQTLFSPQLSRRLVFCWPSLLLTSLSRPPFCSSSLFS